MARPLLYIHGFASSGHSAKARLLKTACDNVYTPTVVAIPRLAVETLEQLATALDNPLLIGSSLGGYYALYLSDRLGLPAVLVNPVTYLDIPLADVVGLNRSYYDGSRFEFTREHLESLQDFRVENPVTSRLLLLVQLGDELIDHHRTLGYLQGARADVDPGGDHGYRNFRDKIPLIRQFAQSLDQ